MTKTATVHAQQKWEYMELTRRTETFLLNDLNDEGQHGWEMIAVTHGKDRKGDDTWTAFLKRPYVGHAPPSQTTPESAAAKSHEGKKKKEASIVIKIRSYLRENHPKFLN